MNQEGPNDPIPGGSDDPDWLYGNSGEQRGWFPKVCHFGARLAPTKSCKLFFWVEASGSKKICYLIYDIYIYIPSYWQQTYTLTILKMILK